jgi:hypothetical protein
MSNPTNAMIPPSLLSGFTSLALKANEFVTKSTFTNYGEMNSGQGLLFFLILMLLIFLTMWLGAFVFNTSVVKIFPDVKKVSVLDFFGLYIVIHILFC